MVDGRIQRFIVSPLPARVTLSHPDLGRHELVDRAAVAEFAGLLDGADDGSDFVRLVVEGSFLESDGHDEYPLSETATSQVRALLLGTDIHIMANVVPAAYETPDWLIEDIWERGTVPQLSGNSKAGKTTLVIDAIRTLLEPGHLFLGRYPVGPISADDLARGIVFINTENPAAAVERALAPLSDVFVETSEGIVTARSLVRVYNLRETVGGPASFNLLDPAILEQWRRILIQCDECQGDDNWGPLALFADNGTAVLRAVGLDVQKHIGEWFEQLRSLVSVSDTDAGLGVTHATMDGRNALGGTISSAGSDGEWSYFKDGLSGTAARMFSLSPRLGAVEAIPEHKVVIRDGSPVFAATARAGADADIALGPNEESKVLDMLRGEPAGLLTTAITGSGAIGRERRAILEELLTRGAVTSRPDGRRGTRWMLALKVEPDVGASGSVHADTRVVDLERSGP